MVAAVVRRTSPVAGPRPDAAPNDALPVLVPGHDALPARCSHCSSTWIEQQPPEGRHRFGMLVCRTCSRELAWISAPLRQSRPRPAERMARVVYQPTTDGRPGRIRRLILVGSFERRPTCGSTCTEAYGHDAAVHELAGRDALSAELAARRSGVVRTGPLAIDLAVRAVTLDGTECAVTPSEYGILAYLASRIGEICSQAEIVEAVWGAATAELWSSSNGARTSAWHSLRAQIARLRAGLGPRGAELIETITARGYRLRVVPQEDV